MKNMNWFDIEIITYLNFIPLLFVEMWTQGYKFSFYI